MRYLCTNNEADIGHTYNSMSKSAGITFTQQTILQLGLKYYFRFALYKLETASLPQDRRPNQPAVKPLRD